MNNRKKSMSRKIVLRRSTIHGNGVFAARDLPKGTRLIEYRGERLTHEEVDRDYGDDEDNGHTFLFTLNEHYVIDAGRRGNIARWFNHSCNPNCESVWEEDPKKRPQKDRVFIETVRPVRAGEELTYDYCIVLDERHSPRMKKIWACRCGARRCTGTMLKPKRGRSRRKP